MCFAVSTDCSSWSQSKLSTSSPNPPWRSITFIESISPRKEVSLSFLSGDYLFLHSPGTVGHSGPLTPLPSWYETFSLEALAIPWILILPTLLMLQSVYLPPPHYLGWLPSLLFLLSASAPVIVLSLSPWLSQILDLNCNVLQLGVSWIPPSHGTSHLCQILHSKVSLSEGPYPSSSLLLSLHSVSKLTLQPFLQILI